MGRRAPWRASSWGPGMDGGAGRGDDLRMGTPLSDPGLTGSCSFGSFLALRAARGRRGAARARSRARAHGPPGRGRLSVGLPIPPGTTVLSSVTRRRGAPGWDPAVATRGLRQPGHGVGARSCHFRPGALSGDPPGPRPCEAGKLETQAAGYWRARQSDPRWGEGVRTISRPPAPERGSLSTAPPLLPSPQCPEPPAAPSSWT